MRSASEHNREPSVERGGATTVKDYYQLGRLAYQTDGAGALLATFTDDSQGVPVSVVVGSDPTSATARYSYVYNAHGDVVNLVDDSGNVVASYASDTWGALTIASETIPNAHGWTNPYRYDGRDGVRSDRATGLYWMSVRAYDPTLGRFLSRDPLGRAPLFLADAPYAYAGNTPLSNIDPSGQRVLGASNSQTTQKQQRQAHQARMGHYAGCDKACREKNARDGHVADLRHAANGYALLAILVTALGALLDWATEGTLGKLEAIVILATLFVEALPYAGAYFGGSHAFMILSGISGALSFIGGLALTAIGAYKLMGWAAQFSIDAVLELFKVAAGGVPDLLMDIGMKLFATALLYLANGFAAQLWGLYYTANAEAERDQKMSPSAWCSFSGSASC